MKKRGFTLLELVVVMIILGILGTLGIQQYFRMVERARGAEARTILGQIRTAAAGYRLQQGNLTGFSDDWAGIGDGTDQIPEDCTGTHYFEYDVDETISSADAAQEFLAEATRCTSGGKPPHASEQFTLNLTTNFNTGSDVWDGTGGY
jgi:prepilin-type N-terminal cleavage/methylation domain-containing protein